MLKERFGLGIDLKKLEVDLVIAPQSEWEAFQCPLMPPADVGVSAAVRKQGWIPQREAILLEELNEGRDPQGVELCRELIGAENLEFLKHLFGYGEYHRRCVPCRAMVEAHRARYGWPRKDYLLVDGTIPIAGFAASSAAV